MPRLRAIILLSLATSLVVPAAAFAQNTNITRPGATNSASANPGTINYVEGQVDLNGQPLTSKSAAQLAPGQTITTGNGHAEVLLTPGVFLRLGDNSAVTMVSPDLTKTEVQLNRGTAEVEVDQIYKQNDLLVDQGPSQTVLLKNGLYEFNCPNQVRVFDGEASVSPAQNSKQWIKVKSHHELAINGEAVKPQDFDAEQAASQDPLYSWSKLRADYLGQANLKLAESYAGAPGYPGYAPGWAWDPWLYEYTWLPYNGLFWSPFGFGFYSPWYLYGGGYIYPGYGFAGGFYRGGYGYGRAPVNSPYRGGVRGAVAPAPAPAHSFSSGGFHGGGFSGGGSFHGGGGGRR